MRVNDGLLFGQNEVVPRSEGVLDKVVRPSAVLLRQAKSFKTHPLEDHLNQVLSWNSTVSTHSFISPFYELECFEFILMLDSVLNWLITSGYISLCVEVHYQIFQHIWVI